MMQSSSTLPAEQTLFAIEFAPLQKLSAEASALPVLAVLQHPKVAALLDRFAGSDRDMNWWWGNRARWAKLFGRFDRGFNLATIFHDGGYGSPQPSAFFTGAARSSATLRGFEDDFDAMLRGEREQRKLSALTRKQVAVPEMPLQMTKWQPEVGQDSNNRSRRVAYAVRRGRRLAMHGDRYWGNEARHEKLMASTSRVLGALMSSSRGGGVMQLGETPLPDCLVRGVIRFEEHVSGPNKKFTEDRAGRAEQEMKSAGMWTWTGAEARLEKMEGAGYREVWDSYDKNVEGDTFFRALRGDAFGLGDTAAYLPKGALAAMRVAIDDKMTSRWLNNFCEMARSTNDYLSFLLYFRPLLGLDSASPERGLEGVTEAAWALLPPAPGVLAPEMCFLFRLDAESSTPQRALEGVVKIIKTVNENVGDVPIKKLGRGEDAVPYIDLKKVFGMRRGGMRMDTEMTLALKSLFGGGFLSATRVGPYLAIGCNPRTMRKLKRSVAKGETLASREGFAARFPKASGRFLEGWFDWPGIVSRASVIDVALPLAIAAMPAQAMAVQRVAVAAAPGGIVEVKREAPKKDAEEGPKKVKRVGFPTAKELAGLFGEQFLVGSKTAAGNRIAFEGSLVLSPLSICSVVAAYYFVDDGPGGLVSRW